MEKLNLNIELIKFEVGREKYIREGKAFDSDFIESVRRCDAILFGAVSTPHESEIHNEYKSPILTLRKELDLFVNVRPSSNLATNNINQVIVFRENTEGLYSQIEYQKDDNIVVAEKIVSKDKTRKFAEYTFSYLRANKIKQATIVTKSNVLKKTDGMFAEICNEVAQKYNKITVNEEYVDAACYHLVRNPERFHAIITENLYGDILSDLIAGLGDGLGMAISKCYGKEIALFEPVHGSAPDIAFNDLASPYAILLCCVALLKYIGCIKQSEKLFEKIEDELLKEHYTQDLGGEYKTSEILTNIINNI